MQRSDPFLVPNFLIELQRGHGWRGNDNDQLRVLYLAWQFSVTYLTGKTLDQDGDKQVEENVVPESHEGDEVERGPVARPLHAKKEDDVPILLSQHLKNLVPSVSSPKLVGLYDKTWYHRNYDTSIVIGYDRL